MLALSPILADLPFRGDRDYLHSTDLYPALTKFVQEQFSPDAFIENLTIRRPVSHQVRVNLDGPEAAFGSFRCRHGIRQSKGWLVETDEPVVSRIPFDEITATQAAISGEGLACFNKLLPQYSVFELLVVLTKIVSCQQNAAHWWICQMDFHSPLRQIAPLECRYKRKVSDRYLTLDIYQAGQAIGSASGIAATASTLAALTGGL